MEWYFEVLRKYAVFSGRARRKEYWMFALFNIIVLVLIGIVVGFVSQVGASALGTIYALLVFVPGLAVSVRRLHDTGRSGWWLLISLIPLLGWIVLLIFVVLDSQPGENQYGPNPKGAVAG
jgi:uncharacterized membrane protein YhaH (DUF805 family)